ncbi:hypothetical protein TERTU_4489 [Teredinibacter turnerae T7901]|uniref:Uncharacterized protein n=1 Tax=Teredinibacter turnerae (strain ATCC 39867 / T7901) TaxID=377629 RepID=C5BJ75_TERTT|nr:hypothetical protein [Teredinibacter turnerae]ACR13864.1 hypothetical protein TERTU_4489 [Teredinibacter turnerae T7901]
MFLTRKRVTKHKYVYIAVAIVSFLMGFVHGTHHIYWGFSIVALSVVFYPTIFNWAVVLSVSVVFSGIYLWSTTQEVLKIIGGEKSYVLSGDPVAYTLYVLVVTILCWAIFVTKPTLGQENA